MSTFKTDFDNSIALTVETRIASPDVYIDLQDGRHSICAVFPAADAPTIALAFLEAAGVQEAPFDHAESDQLALAHLREHIGIQRAKAEAKEREAKLAGRRDKLADEFTAVNSYGRQLHYTQNLIDRIIATEDRIDAAITKLSGPFDGTEGLDSQTLAYAIAALEAGK